MKPTPQIIFQEYFDLIGVPYSTLDCWKLAQQFYLQVFGIELKHYCEGDPGDKSYVCGLIYTHQKDFVKVRAPKFGDIMTIKIMGVESHIAIYVDNGQILHTTKTTGCVIDRLARWDKLIVGYYSLNPTKENE